MRKGSGHHWDLLLAAVFAVLCSCIGLPWFSAPPIQSIAHVAAMTTMKRVAPGILYIYLMLLLFLIYAGHAPVVDHVCEQRVTTIVTSFIMGRIIFKILNIK